MIRRATDELVALVWLLEQRRATGSYPTKLAVDSVDGALKCSHALFGRHTDFLTMLNNVANAHKHSLFQSDISIVGSDEPVVFRLGLQRNNLKNVPTFHQVSLAVLTESFNAFLRECFQHLRGL